MRSRTLTCTLLAALGLTAVASPAEARRHWHHRQAVAPTIAPAPVPAATSAVTAVVAPLITPAGPSTPAAVEAVTTAPVTNEMSEACDQPASFKAFQAFGDQADYSFAPGGSFETGAPGWSLDGAAVVNTNEDLGIFAGNKALFIRDRGRVVSPWFCVTPAHPNFRFVTYGGEVEMEIDYKVIGDDDIDDDLVGETNGGRTWAPSEKHDLADEIPHHKLAKGVVARIIFEAEDDIYVDNVLVDPYRRG